MAQIIVKSLEEELMDKLKNRARENGRSLQAEVKAILDQAMKEPGTDLAAAKRKIDAIRKELKGKRFPDSAELIREDRDR
jgi:plasmid stability protein